MGTNSIPPEWQLTTLGNIAKKEYGLVDGPFGSNLPASDYVPLGIPVIRGSNLSLGETSFKGDEFVYVSEETAKRLERSLCEPEDIIFTKKGTLGQTGFVPTTHRYKKFLISSNQMKLSVDRKVADPRFVYYYVSSPTSREKIIRDSEVTGVPKTNLAYLRTFPIVLPPLDEQKAIAHVLGTLDDKIELNQQMNHTLESIARALFKSWFIDFDPVRAKMDGRQPAGMDAETAALFPDEFEDSALGQIPKGWQQCTLGDFLNLKRGYDLPQRLRDNGTAPIISSSGLSGYHSTAKIKAPGVVTGRYGTVGQVFYIEEDFWPLNTTLYVQDFKGNNPKVAYYILERVDFNVYADKAAVPGVNRNHVHEEKIVAAPKLIQESFFQAVKPIWKQKKLNSQEIETLSNIRDALLPKLLSGQVSLKKAQKVMEVVA